MTINIEHGVDFVGDPGMVWEIDGKQLVAKLVARPRWKAEKRSRYILTPEALAIAAKMGNGNVSEGIRTALSEAALLRRDLGGVFSQRVSQGIFRADDSWISPCEPRPAVPPPRRFALARKPGIPMAAHRPAPAIRRGAALSTPWGAPMRSFGKLGFCV